MKKYCVILEDGYTIRFAFASLQTHGGMGIAVRGYRFAQPPAIHTLRFPFPEVSGKALNHTATHTLTLSRASHDFLRYASLSRPFGRFEGTMPEGSLRSLRSLRTEVEVVEVLEVVEGVKGVKGVKGVRNGGEGC